MRAKLVVSLFLKLLTWCYNLNLQEGPLDRAEVYNWVHGQDGPLLFHIGLQGDHVWAKVVSDIGLEIAETI